MNKFEIELQIAELIDEQQQAEAEKYKWEQKIIELENEKIKLEKMLESIR